MKTTHPEDLSGKSCDENAPRLEKTVINTLTGQISREWKLKEGEQLERVIKFPDFKQALNYTNRVGQVAEEQQHHPDIFLTYGEVRLNLCSHYAGGLTENDFILAAKIDKLK